MHADCRLVAWAEGLCKEAQSLCPVRGRKTLVTSVLLSWGACCCYGDLHADAAGRPAGTSGARRSGDARAESGQEASVLHTGTGGSESADSLSPPQRSSQNRAWVCGAASFRQRVMPGWAHAALAEARVCRKPWLWGEAISSGELVLKGAGKCRMQTRGGGNRGNTAKKIAVDASTPQDSFLRPPTGGLPASPGAPPVALTRITRVVHGRERSLNLRKQPPLKYRRIPETLEHSRSGVCSSYDRGPSKSGKVAPLSAK